MSTKVFDERSGATVFKLSEEEKETERRRTDHAAMKRIITRIAETYVALSGDKSIDRDIKLLTGKMPRPIDKNRR